MASEHETFNSPSDPETKIWRYMSFAKLVSMLDKRTLYFARPDTFNDPHEGYFSGAPIRVTRDDMVRNKETDAQKYLRGLIASWGWVGAMARQTCYVNCWHVNDVESDGLWRLYGGDLSQMVCIQSTYKLLWDCTGPDVFIGVVKYVDYSKDDVPPLNLFNLLLHKRRSFEHERELRAITTKPGEPSVPGVHHSVSLEKLIESVSLPPGASGWYEATVKSVLTKYGLNVPVNRSVLDEEPRSAPNFVTDPDLLEEGISAEAEGA